MSSSLVESLALIMMIGVCLPDWVLVSSFYRLEFGSELSEVGR